MLAEPKRLARQMRWSPKLSRPLPQWLQFDSGVELSGEAPEHLKVRCQWRPSMLSRPPHFFCGLYLNDLRVYAIDVQPDQRHKNPKLAGKPYSGRMIAGIHEHQWTELGDRYAEPIDDLKDHAAAWLLFCQRTGIQGAPFVDPDKGARSGQMSWL